jgi:hypothetical protein
MELGMSQNNKPKVKIDNLWYSAARTDISGMQPGMKIEFEGNQFTTDSGRQMWGLNKWKVMRNAVTGAPQQASNGGVLPFSVTGPGLDVTMLPFISNTIAHAIQAGLIKTPADLAPWVMGAKTALTASAPARKAERPIQTMADPDFDDDLPPSTYGEREPGSDDEMPERYSQRPDPKSF